MVHACSRVGGTYRGIELEVLFTGILAELVQGENVCKWETELDKMAGQCVESSRAGWGLSYGKFSIYETAMEKMRKNTRSEPLKLRWLSRYSLNQHQHGLNEPPYLPQSSAANQLPPSLFLMERGAVGQLFSNWSMRESPGGFIRSQMAGSQPQRLWFNWSGEGPRKFVFRTCC